MAKWLGAPLARGVSTATRAKDSDRQDACRILDDALRDGELSMEEHRERVSAATKAVTLGDLQRLVADLQVERTRTNARAQIAGETHRVGLAGRCVCRIGAAGRRHRLGRVRQHPLSAGLHLGSRSKARRDRPRGADPAQAAAFLGGLTGLLEQTRKRFGDTMGYRLVIYPEYASLDRVDPADDRRVLAYTYRGGWGDATSSAKSIADVSVVDLSKFDAKTAVGIMRGAPETLGLKQSDVKSMYLIVEPAKDPTTPAALSLSLYVSSDYGGGYLVFAGDGTIKHVSYPS